MVNKIRMSRRARAPTPIDATTELAPVIRELKIIDGFGFKNIL